MFLRVSWKQAVLIEEGDLISGPMERKAAACVQPLLDIKESTWERGVPNRGKSCSGNWHLLDAREFDLKTCIHKKWVFIITAHKAALIFFFNNTKMCITGKPCHGCLCTSPPLCRSGCWHKFLTNGASVTLLRGHGSCTDGALAHTVQHAAPRCRTVRVCLLTARLALQELWDPLSAGQGRFPACFRWSRCPERSY